MNWTHFSSVAREDGLVAPRTFEPRCKYAEALHFARGDAWREWCSYSPELKAYTFKYELANLDELRIATINRATMARLVPGTSTTLPACYAGWTLETVDEAGRPLMPRPYMGEVTYADGSKAGQTVFDWAALYDDYDGAIVDFSDLAFEDRTRSPACWASLFDVDTLVVWRGAKLKEIPCNWSK